jgi:biotin carboxylase
MRVYLTALPPTDSVTRGLIPAATRLGLDVALLTDRPTVHSAVGYGAVVDEIVGCDVRDARAVVDTIARLTPRLGRPAAVVTNSDHLQVETALAAAYVDVPAKDWRACLTAKNKFLMRQRLAAAGIETVRSVVLGPADPVPEDLPMPVVVKPREGVASEDVVFVSSIGELADVVTDIRSRRPRDPLVVEEYLPGPLRTLETLGDDCSRVVLGGFATTLGSLPHFVEERLDWYPPDPAARDHVQAALDAVGIGLGACHTEYVVTPQGPRIVEVNYRVIGDACDFLLADLLGIDLFAAIWRVHLGEPLELSRFDPMGLRGRHGAVVSVVAASSGTIRSAPGEFTTEHSGIRLDHWPQRRVGDRVDLTHTNRDYLGLVRAVGPSNTAVDAALEAFDAEHPWVVER